MHNAEIVFNGVWMWINGTRFQKYPFETKEEVFEMLDNWEKGYSIKRIEKAYKIQKMKFQKIRRCLGIKLKHGGFQKRGEELEERKRFVLSIIEDSKKMQIKDIVQKYNCTEAVVSHIQHNPTSRKILNLS